MLTSVQEEKTFKWMSWAFYFLMLGFLSSPTLVSLFHIIFIVPAIYIFIKGPKITIPKSAWILLGLFGWGLISTLINFETLVKPHRAFQELKFYLFGFLFIPGFYFYFQKASAHQLKKFISMVSFVVIIAFFVGISKSYLGFDPVKMKSGDYHIRSGGFTNYMRYGYASAFLFLLSVGAFFNRDKLVKIINPKWFYPAAFLCFAAVGTSQTRGALLGLLVGGTFLLLKYKPILGKIAIAFGTLFASAIIYFSFINPNVTKIRFLNVNQASNNVRMTQFQSAIKAIQEKPIVGLGADQFSHNVERLKRKYNIKRPDYSAHAHNILLEHGASYGILGIIFLLGFLITWLIEMLRRGDNFGWVIASYVLAFTVSGQVENLFDNTNSHLLFYIYCLSHVLPRVGKEESI